VVSAELERPDPERLIADLHAAAGSPRLAPLRLPDRVPSGRAGILGWAATAGRRVALRILEPSLVDLVTQLERDRHRQQAEIARLEARIAALEASALSDR
jgi:hypothetical protein